MSTRHATTATLAAAPQRRLQPRQRAIASLRLLGAAAALILSVAAFAPAAAAAELKPGEQLPWCRVTVNLASDGKPPVLRTADGWWDAQTNLLITIDAANRPDPFCAPYDPATVVQVQQGKFAPQPMPALAVNVANDYRKHAAAAKAAAAKP